MSGSSGTVGVKVALIPLGATVTVPLMYLPLSALYIMIVPVLMLIGLIGLENQTCGATLVPTLVWPLTMSLLALLVTVSEPLPVVKVNEPGTTALPAVSARGAPHATV